jgi:type VI secretion system (T6SS) effector Hcp
MASDIFAKIGDIKGESSDSKHKDEIEVLSYSWGMPRTKKPKAQIRRQNIARLGISHLYRRPLHGDRLHASLGPRRREANVGASRGAGSIAQLP